MCGQPRLTVRTAPALVLSHLRLAVFWAASSERSLAHIQQVALIVATPELRQSFEAHPFGQSCYYSGSFIGLCVMLLWFYF